MFEVLGSELYQEDPYVFLRELLQNSVDAICMRREILERRGLAAHEPWVIHVTVEHGVGGDARITWRDNGIGMEEYVVRNYLAMAGKSYYQSKDFEREGLRMDPISRFGIGILSCFMVADQVEVDTFRDPSEALGSPRLRIVIPSVRRNFRVEKLSPEGVEVGTTITVFVQGRKLPKDQDGSPVPLDVTTYLSAVAGFVEFPIVIIDGDRKTIVANQQQDEEALNARFGDDFAVQKCDLGFPWTEVFLPQDVNSAREMFREERYDLAADLGLNGYDGAIAFIVPKEVNGDYHFASAEHGAHGVEVVGRSRAVLEPKTCRWHDEWDRPSLGDRYEIGNSRTSRHFLQYAVHAKGILVPSAPAPSLGESDCSDAPAPRIIANISGSLTPRLDLPRREIVRSSEHWCGCIQQAVLRRLSQTRFEELLALPADERFYQLGSLGVFYRVAIEDLWKAFPRDSWPVPLLDASGEITVRDLGELRGRTIPVVPAQLDTELDDMMTAKWLGRKYNRVLVKWRGEECLADLPAYAGLPSPVVFMTRPWANPLLREHYCLAGVRFVTPPWKGDPPLLQRMLVPGRQSRSSSEVVEALCKARDRPETLAPDESELLQETSGFYRHDFPEFIEFPTPFQDRFAFGWAAMNLNHRTTQAFVRCFCALELARTQKTMGAEDLGRLRDAVGRLPTGSPTSGTSRPNLTEFSMLLRSFFVTARDTGLCELENIDQLVPKKDDFVEGTLSDTAWVPLYELDPSEVGPFGMPLA